MYAKGLVHLVNFGVFKHNTSEEKKIMRSIQNKTPDDKNFLGV